MLSISQRQMDVLGEALLADMKPQLRRRAERLYPVDVALIGDGLEGMITHAIRRAIKHRLATNYDLFAYYDLMFALGTWFDTDPFLPWAGQALSGQGDSTSRMRTLGEDANYWIESATGEEGQFAVRALVRAQRLLQEDVVALRVQTPALFVGPGADPEAPPAELPALPARSAMDQYRTFLADVHPEKFRTIGSDAMDHAITEALRRADMAGLTSPIGKHTYLLLSFMIGSGFARDPLFPWAADALRESAHGDRGIHLFNAAQKALAAAFEQIRHHAPA